MSPQTPPAGHVRPRLGGGGLALAVLLFCRVGNAPVTGSLLCSAISTSCKTEAVANCKTQHFTFTASLYKTMTEVKSRTSTARAKGQLGPPPAAGSAYKDVVGDGIDDALVHSFMTGWLATRVHYQPWMLRNSIGRKAAAAKASAIGFMNSREECNDDNAAWMDMNNNRVGGDMMAKLTESRCTLTILWRCVRRKEYPPSSDELWNALLAKAASARYVATPKNHRYDGSLIHFLKADTKKQRWTRGSWGSCRGGVKRRSVSCPAATYLCLWDTKPPTSTRGGCSQPPPPPPACISGDMVMWEQTRGQMRVADLIPGDVVEGIDGDQASSRWCTVEGVYLANHGLEQTTFDGVTAMHMTVQETQPLRKGLTNENATLKATHGAGDDPAPPPAPFVVAPQGTVGEEHVGQVYTLVTDCDAVQNADGRLITPISTLFCPIESMSWRDYRMLFGAIRRVTTKTGPFWYNLESFHDNETAASKEYQSILPRLCETLLECASDGVCQHFERTITEFVESYVDPELVAASVMAQFPHLGETAQGNRTVPGSVSAAVRDGGDDDYATEALAAAAAILVVALCVLVVVLVKTRKRLSLLLERVDPIAHRLRSWSASSAMVDVDLPQRCPDCSAKLAFCMCRQSAGEVGPANAAPTDTTSAASTTA